VDLPPTAIGKDYLGHRLTATAPSGSGFQVSLFGMLGVLASRVEGFEINVLGLTFGVDPYFPAFKLPMIGRLGVDQHAGRKAKLPALAVEVAGAQVDQRPVSGFFH